MAHSSLILDNNWDTTLSELSKLTNLDATAREFDAFERGRGIDTPSNLLRVALCYGEGLSLRQVCAWAAAAGVADISNPALLERLSKAANWLEHLAKLSLAKMQPQPSGPWTGWRIRLVDATTLSCPGAKGTTWRLHAGYDLAGWMVAFQLTNGKGAESLCRFEWGPGDIAVGDRGYAKAKDLLAVVEAGGHVVTRIGWNALRLTDVKGGPFDLFAAMRTVADKPVDVLAKVDTREKGRPHLPVRLLIARLPEDKAEEARKKIKAKAARQGKETDPRSLEAAGYIVILTSLPAAYATEDILTLYRLRWQIELFFKRIKSLLDFGELPAKREALARAWIFSKLIIVLLAEKMARQIVESDPQPPSKPTRRSPLPFLCQPVWSLFDFCANCIERAILHMQTLDLSKILHYFRNPPRKRQRQAVYLC